MTDLTLHFLLFIAAGAVLILAPLVIGIFIRPNLPTEEKVAVYECGEPTIGSSYIQFDIRFYVVALLFIIFDVEVVFFFPWATVFGGATQLADARLSEPTRMNLTDRLLSLPPGTTTPETMINPPEALSLAGTGMVDILTFFGVLLVGFAYVWHRGDLDWVRAMVKRAQASPAPHRTPSIAESPAPRELVS
ncbi:NADH-quinone oxidoreductase subunit A [Planctomicrobium piriforme]|uniref:NADH-quinone oxidoreductase subunit n=1 Tax=Planctomicrobium piriforme TaxID=1576369 RepID=A0A1I3I9F4_9PLAN|nr:NADH-quinone oxidoreductase subunit A [Planctomicrobium piriforme]SFI44457.1 NADH-quinone oxidoreductase subunit A [Planctomicrobium piriforme]